MYRGRNVFVYLAKSHCSSHLFKRLQFATVAHDQNKQNFAPLCMTYDPFSYMTYGEDMEDEEGCRVTVGGGLEKLSQGRNFFFLVSTPAQLSAYANHEFKIIPTPAQLSAYANHELKN